MVAPLAFEFKDVQIDEIADFKGRVAVLVGAEGRMDVAARRVNRLTKGAVKRMIEEGLKPGVRVSLLIPQGWLQMQLMWSAWSRVQPSPRRGRPVSLWPKRVVIQVCYCAWAITGTRRKSSTDWRCAITALLRARQLTRLKIIAQSPS